MEKVFNNIKTVLGKVLASLTALVAIMTFVDFLLKWKIYLFLFSVLNKGANILLEFIFETFILFWLLLLSYLFWKINRQVKNSKPNELQEQLTSLKTTVEEQIKKLSDSSNAKVKSIEKRINEKIFNIEYSLVEFEIERYRSNNQVGEVSQMIKKLNMDFQRGWGAEDTLLEIRGYIEKSGMPSYFLDDLHKAIEKLPDSIKGVGEGVFSLAQTKMYNPK
ncbi:MAG: hypothetical protein WDZ80_01480 [Candidatus Paceibacterota bacterium]